jgi:hypothetical protein
MEVYCGLIEFEVPLFCAADVLGKSFDIKIADVSGTLTLPSLPVWGKNESDPLHKCLIPPKLAQTWQIGEKPLFWGKPTSYPSGTSLVERALLQFELEKNNKESKLIDIYRDFERWYNLFSQYSKLQTKSVRQKRKVWGDSPRGLDLYISNDTELKRISKSDLQEPIVIELSNKDTSLHYPQVVNNCSWASKSWKPRLEYQLLLQAYTSVTEEDWRSVIIESSAALEISLSQRVKNEPSIQGVKFSDKLLKKFRMLSGSFELLDILGIKCPIKDFKTKLLEPRNKVVHKGKFPTKGDALEYLNNVETVLDFFSPKLYDNTP